MTGQTPNSFLLTERERQILALCADGLGDIEIGQQLGLSAKTVNYHIEKMKNRTNARNRAHLVALAIRRQEIS